MRVLERGLLTLDQLYITFLFHLQGSMKQRKTAKVHDNIRALPKIKTNCQSWKKPTISILRLVINTNNNNNAAWRFKLSMLDLEEPLNIDAQMSIILQDH